MPRLERAVAVAAPVEQVWAAVVDWDRQGEWVPATRVRGGRGEGAEVVAVTGVRGRGLVDTMRITRWEPPHRCDVLHTGRVVRGTASLVVTPTPGGSQLTWREDVELPLGRLGLLGWPLVRPPAEAWLRLALKRFARWAPAHRAG